MPTVKQLVKQAMNEKNVVSPVRMAQGAPPVRLRSIQETFIAVQEFDPITFLGKVMRGDPVETLMIDRDGEHKIIYESPGIKERVNAAKFLASKLMPTVHAHKIIPATPYDGDGIGGSVDDVFRRIVTKAIDKARDAGSGSSN